MLMYFAKKEDLLGFSLAFTHFTSRESRSVFMHANLNDRKQVESFYNRHTHMGLYAHKHCPLVLSYTATLLARSKYSTVNKPGTLPKMKRKKMK